MYLKTDILKSSLTLGLEGFEGGGDGQDNDDIDINDQDLINETLGNARNESPLDDSRKADKNENNLNKLSENQFKKLKTNIKNKLTRSPSVDIQLEQGKNEAIRLMAKAQNYRTGSLLICNLNIIDFDSLANFVWFEKNLIEIDVSMNKI